MPNRIPLPSATPMCQSGCAAATLAIPAPFCSASGVQGMGRHHKQGLSVCSSGCPAGCLSSACRSWRACNLEPLRCHTPALSILKHLGSCSVACQGWLTVCLYAESMVEAMHLRFHLSVVVKTLAQELGQAMQAVLGPPLRRSLFEALVPWTEDGPVPDLGPNGLARSDWQSESPCMLIRSPDHRHAPSAFYLSDCQRCILL